MYFQSTCFVQDIFENKIVLVDESIMFAGET